MKSNSWSFRKCMHEAFLMNENLMPVDCIEILERNYGKRLETITPKTMVAMVEDMLRTSTDCTDGAYEVVQDYCNSY